MRFLSSRFLTAALLFGATGLCLLLLWAELTAAITGAVCARDHAAGLLVGCDEGPGGLVISLTVGLTVSLAVGAGMAMERARARSRHD